MYQPLSFEEIRANILAEYRNKIAGADISVGSEIYARASVFAAGCSLLSYGLVYVERQIFPDTADTGNLEHHAALYDLERKEPTAATGQILLTGTNGTVVSSGLTLVHADGTEFTTTSGGTIASGELAVNAAAAVGSAGNRITGDALTVQSPPAGVDAEAEVSGDFSGGTDDETDDALRARVLARMRAGNAGGRAGDYEQWALAIDGVVAADCLATRRGPGTVSIAVYTEGAGGVRTPADSVLRASVLAAVDVLRPVTAEVDVPAITEVTVNVTVADLEVEAGYDPADVATAVEAAIEAHIYGLTTGETLYRSRLGRAISAVDGVLDYELTVPATNVDCVVDSTHVEVLIPGTVAVT